MAVATVKVTLADFIPEFAKVVDSSIRYNDCLAEFDGDDSACGEWRDAWIDTVDALKAAQAERDNP